MFANLTYEDEYFASRPGLSVGSSPTSPTHLTSPTRTAPSRSPAPPFPSQPSPARESSPSNFFSSFTSSHSKNDSSQSAPDKASMTREETDAAKEAQRLDLLTRFAIAGVKHGTSSARSGLGMVAGNKRAMNALGDLPGAQGLVRGADGFLNPNKARNKVAAPGAVAPNGGEEDVEAVVMEKKKAPPVAEKKKGVSGLISGKSFGHVDTSSKMGAFTSMWKDPQKVQAPLANAQLAPPMPRGGNSLPPPMRTGSSGSVPVTRTTEVVQIVETVEAEGQAQVLYDYEGADAGDLGVQSGQIVNVIEKASADWWSCEDGNGTRGLVPANYLKEI